MDRNISEEGNSKIHLKSPAVSFINEGLIQKPNLNWPITALEIISKKVNLNSKVSFSRSLSAEK